MKLLLVSPYLPHPKSGHGTGVFMYGLLRQIAPKHTITLLTFCNKEELELSRDLISLPLELITVPRGRGAQQSLMWNIYLVAVRLLQLVRSIVLWQPYYVSKYRHPAMVRYVRQLTQDRSFDIVQFEMAQMAQYVSFVKRGKTILHEHDVTFRPAYRQYRKATSRVKKTISFIEWCRWSIYERRMTRKFDCILSVTEQDKMLLEWLSGTNRVRYFPRGVDIPESLPVYSSREQQSILFVGTFSHRPNTDAAFWLAQEIFPLVLKKLPDAVLYIIGKNPPSELSLLAQQIPQLKLLGFVDDVDKYFRRCSLFVAPLRFGGGVKVKILHAMAQGIPVVTTKIGTEGIQGIQSETVLVGDSAQRLAEYIVSLLINSDKAERVGNNGCKAMRTWYSWERIVSQLEKIYYDTLQS